MDNYFSHTIDFCRAWLSGQEEFIVHTSGSTGAPKPIYVHRAQMQASAHATVQALNLQADDTALVCLNTAFIAGKMMLIRGLEVGMNMIVVPPSSKPLEQLTIINEQLSMTHDQLQISNCELEISNFQFLVFNKFMIINYLTTVNNQQTINYEQRTRSKGTIDFFSFVPLQILAILKQSTINNQQLPINNQQLSTNNQQATTNQKPETINHKLNSAKAIIIGGAPVNAELDALLQTISSPVYATYGMTETVSHIALKRLNGKEKSPYYQALPNTILGQDERNCLTIVSSVTNFEKIITNDKVNLIDETHFEWLGRVDNVINSGGVKIQIEKVESEIDMALLQLRIFCRFVVLGLPHNALGEAVTLVLEESDEIKEKEDLLLKINQLTEIKLTKYEKPNSIRFVSKFPETETNKISRLELWKLLIE